MHRNAWLTVATSHIKWSPLLLEQDECHPMLELRYYVGHAASTDICSQPTGMKNEKEITKCQQQSDCKS